MLEDHRGTMVWIDNDAVVIKEPDELSLPINLNLAYTPVMHNRAGSLFDNEPDELWARIYELQGLDDSMLFPMTTPVDQQRIRSYFHCGLLAVRPALGVMREWAKEFTHAYQDPLVQRLCENSEVRQVFLHQHVLTGAILHKVGREAMKDLSGRYNYPMLFDRQYQAPRPFDSLDEVAILRRVVSLEKIGPDWYKQVKGPPAIIAWLKEHVTSWH